MNQRVPTAENLPKEKSRPMSQYTALKSYDESTEDQTSAWFHSVWDALTETDVPTTSRLIVVSLAHFTLHETDTVVADIDQLCAWAVSSPATVYRHMRLLRDRNIVAKVGRDTYRVQPVEVWA